jgi:RNA polymerase sigma factor (sigma-70 family)
MPVDVSDLVRAAQQGNLAAFAELVRRYQGMAIAYAYALLRDLHLAQDAAQEAFVAAYLGLGQVDEPAVFPGWLRTVVRTQCNRMTRRRRVEAVSLDRAGALPAEADAPERQAERGDARAHILRAVAELPRVHREVLTLYYVREHSQREIAAFLGVPVTTVNARLHAARGALRDRILALVREALRAGALPQDFPGRVAGAIADWRRVREAERFGVWPSLSPDATPLLVADGFRPQADPSRCGCRRLAWPCPRYARLEGVDPVPPLGMGAP